MMRMRMMMMMMMMMMMRMMTTKGGIPAVIGAGRQQIEMFILTSPLKSS